jgi:enoyl-CoA hydratase/carnithine racemase
VTEDLVLVRRDGPVAVVTLNRPSKLNALSAAVEQQLLDAVESDEVSTAGAVVVHGAGRSFCAGADVTEFRGLDPRSILDYYAGLGRVYELVADLPVVTIAAIHGYCIGGGFEMSLACDVRVAERTAIFGLPEVALGIVPSSGGLTRLVRAVGPARAKEAMLWHERLSAEQAHSLGLVSEVVDGGNALSTALAGAERVADLPPLAVRIIKQGSEAAAESSRAASLLVEQLSYAALAQTEEADAAAAAFENRD